MLRERAIPRQNWQQKVESVGLSFHSEGGLPYWCEDHCYSFTNAEIDQLEDATNALHELCVRAAERLIVGGDLERLSIPSAYWPMIAASWQRRDPDLYGRFDLAYAGSGAPKLLEYNADTPTALLEAAVVQWYWLEDTKPAADQFNSIHERLIAAWKSVGAKMNPGDQVHFTGVFGEAEDRVTVDYMRDVCQQAGIATVPLDVADIGWNGRDFTDLDERAITILFKLYPWEWMLGEDFAAHLLGSRTRFIEPPWKMVLSTKAILPILWEMFPGHPNLLPASFDRSGISGRCIEKPIHGREGEGIRLLSAQAPGGGGDRVWQAYHPLPQFDGRHVVIGSWVIGGEAAGMGLRESSGPITGNDSLFVPHWFGERKTTAAVSLPDRMDTTAVANPAADPRLGFPRNAPVRLTPALLTLLVAVFVGELAFAPRLDASALVALGGLNRDLILQKGQWYRLISAVFLHGSVIHLLCNAAVLGFAGWNLERIVGSRWLAAVYTTGALVGALVSMAYNLPNVVSVGASGAIMGLLAALFVLTFRERWGAARFERQVYLLRLLVPALIPAAAGAHVDVGAHLGGAIGGAVIGLMVTRAWGPAHGRE